MNQADVTQYYETLLRLADFKMADPALNGLQVSGGRDIKRIAFAVDACQESIQRAIEGGAQALVVHHGLIWRERLQLAGAHRDRLKLLFDADINLYAFHLPLDQHPEVGNNAQIAKALGLEDPRPFADYHGVLIGWMGRFAKPVSFEEALCRVAPENQPVLARLPFGPKEIRSAGICSGGAAQEVDQAIAEGLDLYVTGEMEHQVYHLALEARINMICAGHYRTETWGVRALSERVAKDLGLECFFIEAPTGF